MKMIVTLAVAVAAAAAGAHEPVEWNGSTIQVILDKQETGGDMGMFTTRFPGPGGPPRHIHDDAGEAVLVLEGSAEILVDGETRTLGKGEAGFVPTGVEHTFRILDEGGGTLLVVITPGGFEGFFEATKHLRLPDEIETLNEISAEYGQVFTGPPIATE